MPRHVSLTRLAFAEIFGSEVRYAARNLRRSRGFAVTVIATLALGIGANAVMFSVVDRLMFRPLAYLRDPATVHRIYWQWQDRGTITTTTSSPYTRYLDLRRSTHTFAGLAAFSERPLAVGSGESSHERRVGAVSASFFDFFDARPALGRFFTAAEDVTPRGADVAVLSYAYWQSGFAGRNVLGETLDVGNVRAVIVGVAPEGFNGVNDADPPAIYLPITTFAGSTGTDDSRTYYTRYQWGWMNVLVRRNAGATVAQAEADATQAFIKSWDAAQVDSPGSPAAEEAKPRAVVSTVRPGAGPTPALEARTALWLSAVSGIVLLIACANVANLFLARAFRRQRETSIRLALGVSRLRLVVQPLVEGLLLSFAGALAALLFATLAHTALRRLLVGGVRQDDVLFADWRTLAATLALTVCSGLVVGLLPAWLLGRADLGRVLRGGARGGVADGARLRTTLLVMQAALSVVLLVGAALFVRSLDAVQSMRMGYDPERVLIVSRVHRGPLLDDKAQRAMRDRLLAEAQSLASVEAAAWVSSAPFISTSSTNLVVPEIGPADGLGRFSYQATTPDYFRAMGTRIIRGRGFTPDDRAGTPDVAVISQGMANVLWPQQEALGKCFRMRSATAPCVTVVGIAEDIVQRTFTDSERYHYYLSIHQYTRTWGNGLVIRTYGNPARAADGVRQALQRVMPDTSYVNVRPLEDIVGEQQRSWRLGAALFFYFGVLALAVAAVGLYGVVSYSVAQRMHELSVRVALGAARTDVFALVLGQGLRVAAAGAVAGIAAARAVSRWIQPLLYAQSATDPLVYGVVATLMIGVALAASAVPAFVASRVDPNAALRAD